MLLISINFGSPVFHNVTSNTIGVSKLKKTKHMLCQYKKRKVEDCLCLSIFELYRGNAIEDKNTGTISWGFHLSADKMLFSIYVKETVGYLKLEYALASTFKTLPGTITEEILLIASPCPFGGIRWWFCCPGVISGKICGKRVAKLYKPNYVEPLACRTCHDLNYAVQHFGGHKKEIGKYTPIFKLMEMEKSIKRTFYRGLPTKRYNSFLKKSLETREAISSEVAHLKRVICK